MKKCILVTLFCMLGITFSNSIHAFSIIYPGSVTAPIKEWRNLKVSEFMKLSPKDFSKITGKRMNLKERISFSFMKARMKYVLKKNPNITVSEYLASSRKIGTLGWIAIIALGLILLFLLVYIISVIVLFISHLTV